MIYALRIGQSAFAGPEADAARFEPCQVQPGQTRSHLVKPSPTFSFQAGSPLDLIRVICGSSNPTPSAHQKQSSSNCFTANALQDQSNLVKPSQTFDFCQGATARIPVSSTNPTVSSRIQPHLALISFCRPRQGTFPGLPKWKVRVAAHFGTSLRRSLHFGPVMRRLCLWPREIAFG
jgi:hypothetical protein